MMDLFFYWTGIIFWSLVGLALFIMLLGLFWYVLLQGLFEWNRQRATIVYQLWEAVTLLYFIYWFKCPPNLNGRHFYHHYLPLVKQIKQKPRMKFVRNLYARSIRKAKK